MQLKLRNIAKVKEATIDIDGITVIAGENNTGKSTIGKVLFTVFNSMNNMDSKIRDKKQNQIENIILLLIQNWSIQYGITSVEYRKKYRARVGKLAKKVMELSRTDSIEKIETVVREFVKEEKLGNIADDTEDFIEECVAKLEKIISISDEKVMTEVITRWFNEAFESQVSPLNGGDIISDISLKIKGKEINFSIQTDRCIYWHSEVNILQDAFYIDNPFIVDYMSNYSLRRELKTTDKHLLEYLCKEEDMFDNLFGFFVVREKLNEVEDIFSKVIDGRFRANEMGEYCLLTQKFNKPIYIKNLSTGLKAFALIKRLLENGSLKEKDVLILDEPEIHLHPEWQLVYAEIIVLLQKLFDLKIIITTHSPYFLDAIDVFSAKYKMSDKVNYYLAENVDNVSYLQNVTGNIDIIYKKLSDPLQKLENMRWELS